MLLMLNHYENLVNMNGLGYLYWFTGRTCQDCIKLFYDQGVFLEIVIITTKHVK